MACAALPVFDKLWLFGFLGCVSYVICGCGCASVRCARDMSPVTLKFVQPHCSMQPPCAKYWTVIDIDD